MSTKIGDIFQISVSESEFCYGQVILKKSPIYYMALFEGVFDKPMSAQDIVKLPIALLGNFFDIKLKNGDWRTIGNIKPVLNTIPFPCYKVKIGDDFVVLSWNEKSRRKATPEEILTLDFPTNFSAMVLENAAKACSGRMPWTRDYETLKRSYVEQRDLDIP